MKVEINWWSTLMAVVKAICPFAAGILGGLFSGCSLNGPGIGAML